MFCEGDVLATWGCPKWRGMDYYYWPCIIFYPINNGRIILTSWSELRIQDGAQVWQYWHERRHCSHGNDVFQTLHSKGIMDKWNRAEILPWGSTLQSGQWCMSNIKQHGHYGQTWLRSKHSVFSRLIKIEKWSLEK